jgi:hypothetical protein
MLLLKVFGHLTATVVKNRNSVYWLMDDIDLHSLPGADEVSGDVVVAGQ